MSYSAQKGNIFFNSLKLIRIFLSLQLSNTFIVLQSDIKEIVYSAYLFAGLTSFSRLKEMNQFKEKKKKLLKKSSVLPILLYPLLMAADIIVLGADEVIVGKDQLQHLELCRRILKKLHLMSELSGKKTNNLITDIRIMENPDFKKKKIYGLRNPRQKMSKTSTLKGDVIYLTDTFDEVNEKITKSVTDNEGRIYFHPAKKPGVSNLLYLLSIFSHQAISVVEKKCENLSYSEFKKLVSEVVNLELEKIRKGVNKKIISDEEIKKNLLTGKEWLKKKVLNNFSFIKGLILSNKKGLVPE